MLKKIIIVIAIIILLALGAFTYLYFTSPESLNSITSNVGINVSDFFPFGQEPTTPTNTTNNSSGDTPPNTTPAQLRQIYSSPVSGGQFFNINNNTAVRFVEQSTGNVYEANTENTAIERITNTTIPKVTEATFVTKDSVLLRFLRDDSDLIETVYGTISTTTSTSTVQSEFADLQTTFLFPNIKDLVVSPKKDKVFYINQFSIGALGTIASPNGSNKTVAFESPIREWNTQWPTTTTLALTTAPSAQVSGYLYFVNTTTGTQQKILANIPGLTTLTNTNTSSVLYTKNNLKGSFSLNLLNTKTGTSTLLSFGQTLPEKCVWSKKNVNVMYCAVPKVIPKGEYPDIWYMGLVSFSDKLWRINTETNETDMLVDLESVSGRTLDAIKLSLDTNENYILFTNKADSTLWSFALNK